MLKVVESLCDVNFARKERQRSLLAQVNGLLQTTRAVERLRCACSTQLARFHGRKGLSESEKERFGEHLAGCGRKHNWPEVLRSSGLLDVCEEAHLCVLPFNRNRRSLKQDVVAQVTAQTAWRIPETHRRHHPGPFASLEDVTNFLTSRHPLKP